MAKIEKGAPRQAETKEPKTEPIIYVHFFFGAHRRKADLLGLPLDEVDIYLTERSNVDEQTKQAYKLVVQGKLKPQEAIDQFLRRDKQHSPYWEAELGEMEMLYGRNIIVDFFDVPKNTWLSKPFQGFIYEPKLTKGKVTFDLAQPTFDVALRAINSQSASYDFNEKQRERQIEQILKMKIRTLSKQVSGQRKKQEIKVLIFLGASHQSVYNTLRSNPKFRVSCNSYDFKGYAEELSFKHANNLPINNELRTHVLLELLLLYLLQFTLKDMCHDSQEEAQLLYQIASGFSYDEIESIWNAVKNGAVFEDLVLNKFREQNLGQLLAHYRPPIYQATVPVFIKK